MKSSDLPQFWAAGKTWLAPKSEHSWIVGQVQTANGSIQVRVPVDRYTREIGADMARCLVDIAECHVGIRHMWRDAVLRDHTVGAIFQNGPRDEMDQARCRLDALFAALAESTAVAEQAGYAEYAEEVRRGLNRAWRLLESA